MSEYINDFEVRKAILELLGGDSTNCSNIYEVDLEILKIYEEGGGGTGGGGSTGEKTKVAEININNSCIVDGKWNANAIDVSVLTSLNYFFDNCSSLIEVDLSGWDVSKVTYMQFMFNRCQSLQSISGLSNWNTSNVTNMNSMFAYCNALQSVDDLSGWNVGNVTYMYYMFGGCNSLQNLNLSGWNVSKVTSMSSMFNSCKLLQSVGDLSGWNTGNVKDVSDMFGECNSLQNLNLSGWNVGNVTNMRGIFYNCNSLQSVGDLSGWNVGNVTNMYRMFYICKSLQNLNLSGWNVGNVTNMNAMFEKCKSLQNLNLSNWNTSNVTTMDYVFYDANINNLDITGWTDVSNVTSIVGLCSNTSNIPTFVGGRTVDDVINNNITILNGLKIATTNFLLGHYADRASVRALINGLADLTGQSTVTLNLTSVFVKEKLTEEDIAIATAKNWTIA